MAARSGLAEPELAYNSSMSFILPAVALVTGGAKRVGREIVLELARAGCDIGLHYRSSHEDARRTAAEVQQLGRRCAVLRHDLADPASWARLIEETAAALGRLDVLVNNASMFDPAPPRERRVQNSEFDPQEWDQMLRVNCTAAAGLCHHARPHLNSGAQGRIINLCDVAAEKPWPGYLSYCCSKAALVALTRGLARAYAPKITVNGISPGIAVFPEEYPQQLREALVAQVPLERAGTPQEVARLVRYLVVEGGYITGQIITIDGGRSLL